MPNGLTVSSSSARLAAAHRQHLARDRPAPRWTAALPPSRKLGQPGSKVNDPTEYGGHVRRRIGDDFITYIAEPPPGTGDPPRHAGRTRGHEGRSRRAVYYRDLELPWLLRREKEPTWVARKQVPRAVLSGHPYGRSPEPAQFENATLTVRWTSSRARMCRATRRSRWSATSSERSQEVDRRVVRSLERRSPKLPAPPPAAAAAAKGEVHFLRRRGSGPRRARSASAPLARGDRGAPRRATTSRAAAARTPLPLAPETAGAPTAPRCAPSRWKAETAYLDVIATSKTPSSRPPFGKPPDADRARANRRRTELTGALERAASITFSQITNEAARRSSSRRQNGYSLESGDELRSSNRSRPRTSGPTSSPASQSNPTLSLVGETV